MHAGTGETSDFFSQPTSARQTLKAAILRTVLVYGITPNMSRSNVVLWVKKSLEENKTINVVTDQARTPTLAEDLAQGCALAETQKAVGIYNISGKDFFMGTICTG